MIVGLEFEGIDWTAIRQALSLSLLKKRPLKIAGGGAFLSERPEYMPLFLDISDLVERTGAGKLSLGSGSIVFEPRGLGPGNIEFETRNNSSAVELLLFVMPALFFNDFRSVVRIGGVTHSHLSYSTAFVKETLLALLEKIGFYASLSLKKFGFYNSGGGSLESRVYPSEAAPWDFGGLGPAAVEGAKIIISRIDGRVAASERGMIMSGLGIGADRTAVLEVMDSPGFGNSVQVCVRAGGIPFIFSREAVFFNEAGDLVYDEEKNAAAFSGTLVSARDFSARGEFPPFVMREILPYLFLSGSRVPGSVDPNLKDSLNLCGALLR
ncbi:MAG: hypothetical protein MUD12_15075 [Spirochaetes bacterium]|nr:hypothetical protein [Spirochaetota bacterium]